MSFHHVFLVHFALRASDSLNLHHSFYRLKLAGPFPYYFKGTFLTHQSLLLFEQKESGAQVQLTLCRSDGLPLAHWLLAPAASPPAPAFTDAVLSELDAYVEEFADFAFVDVQPVPPWRLTSL